MDRRVTVSLAQRAESLRAYHRARNCLKEGDKLCVSRCGGGRSTFIFAGWDGYWMVGKSGGNDYAPSAIVSLNGEKVSFLDPPWERPDYDPDTGRPWGDHGTLEQALEWALEDGDRIREVDDVETFLRVWREGRAWEEWPEFYRWLAPFPKAAMQAAVERSRSMTAADFEELNEECPY